MLQYFLFLPELYIIFFIFFLLFFTTLVLHYKYKDYYLQLVDFVILLCIFCLLIVCIFLCTIPSISVVFDFGLRIDFWAVFSKLLIAFFSILYTILVYINRQGYLFVHTDFVMLTLSVIFSGLVLVSSNDFLILFLSLDLQAICIFVLIAYNSGSMKSTEAAWKYFVLNGFASSLILLGICFFYFHCGSISFSDFSSFFSLLDLSTNFDDSGMAKGVPFLSLWFGIFSFSLGFFAKIGLAPFHGWLIDVFDGTSEILLPIVAIISKIGQFSIFFYFVTSYLYNLVFLQYMCIAVGMLSVFFTAIQILFQVRTKRLVALLSVYSSGIVVVFFSSPLVLSWSFGFFYLFVSSFLLYLFVYVYITLVNVSTNRPVLDNMFNFTLLAQNNFEFAIVVTFIFVSLLGLPPLVGFFPKFFFLYCLSKSLFIWHIAIFLVHTLVIIFIFVYLIKEFFFSVEDRGLVNTLSFVPLTFSNTLFLFSSILFSLFLLFFGSAFILNFLTVLTI